MEEPESELSAIPGYKEPENVETEKISQKPYRFRVRLYPSGTEKGAWLSD